MFIDFIYQIFGGCSSPTEYILVLLLFYMCMEFVVRLVAAVLSIGRR